MTQYIKFFTLLCVGLLLASCADQFDDDRGQTTFPAQPRLGGWKSLGNDSTKFDVLFYLFENKEGDTVNATVYIAPERNALDFSRLEGDITYSKEAGVVDVLYMSSPWTAYYKTLYNDVTTTLQRISLTQRFDGNYGMQTAIHLVIPGYDTPPVGLLFCNVCTFKEYCTPYGKWEDTNENYNTFFAAFNPNGTVEVITPWGEDTGTFSFNENTGIGEMTLENESEPLKFGYNTKKQLAITYDSEDYTLLPIEF